MDLDFLKTFAMTEKTQEDVDTIMSMTQGLPFVINYNNADIHRLICQNMRIKDYREEQTIYDSSTMENIDFLIYSGVVQVFLCEKKEQNDAMTLIREVKDSECFGSFEKEILQKNSTKFDKIVAIAKEKSKILIFENSKQTLVPLKTKREMFLSQRETVREATGFDPEIFLFDDPTKINDIIDKVRAKVNEEFQNVNEYKDVFSKLNSEKEFSETASSNPKREFKEIFGYIDSKFGSTYTDIALLDLKLGMIALKTIENIPKTKNEIDNSLTSLKEKFYDKNNAKNRNLIQMNIEKELDNEDFHDYIYEEISKIKKLDELLSKKKKNENKIEQNKRLIKKEENLLLNTYYCIYCHIRPRDAISMSCNHLVICEECMKKTKICPKCGVNIDSYHKIYRS